MRLFQSKLHKHSFKGLLCTRDLWNTNFLIKHSHVWEHKSVLQQQYGTESSKLPSIPTLPQLICSVPKILGMLEVSEGKPVPVTTKMSACICSSWPWSCTTNLSVSGLAFKWKRWSASLSEGTSQLPLQHGFHVFSSVSTKWGKVFICTSQETWAPLLCAV